LTGDELDNWDLIPVKGWGFSLHYCCVQTGPGTMPTSYPMSTRGFSPVVK
jgi:hypothetical protein